MRRAERRRFVLPLVLVLICHGSSFVAAAGAAGNSGQLWNDRQAMLITLEGPIGRIAKESEGKEEYPGKIRYLRDDGTEMVIDVKLRARGKSRLHACRFAPLRLNFKRKQLTGTPFSGQKKLKMVTQCRPGSKYRDYLRQEYQIYRLFNVLTDRSFRVRWLNVTYVDIEKPSERFAAPAFLIESERELSQRLGLRPVDVERVEPLRLDPLAATLGALFHYAIGNTDWSAVSGPPGSACCHNGAPLLGSDGRIIVVPYDFDQAGLINTAYAQPSTQLNIKSVRERLYRGFCVHNGAISSVIELFDARRSALDGVLEDELVSVRRGRMARDYLRESLAIFNDPTRRERELLRRCRG